MPADKKPKAKSAKPRTAKEASDVVRKKMEKRGIVFKERVVRNG